jgi:prophage antirepressor-like protein
MTKIYETLDENYIKFESHKISVIIDNNNNDWFNANEIAIALGYVLPKKAITNNVGKKDKIKLENINTDIVTDKHPHSIYINESGLYSLLLSSRLKKAQKFKDWITHDVIPSIRKYGYYKLKNDYNTEINDLMEKLNYLKKENENMKNEMKVEKFPDGGIVYVIDYSDDEHEIYRIGKSGDMKIRKNVYNTHMLYKKEVLHYKETECPIALETCIRAMLYKYRVKNRKDFYECDINIIKKAFKSCLDSLECMNQKGGFVSFDKTTDNLKNKISNIQLKVKDLSKELKIIYIAEFKKDFPLVKM